MQTVQFLRDKTFQSTLSVRRATRAARERLLRQRISIHALRKESDRLRLVGLRSRRLFQSTLSVRRATILAHGLGANSKFQSTLSVRRATHHPDYRNRLVHISIHALRKESDYLVAVNDYPELISIHALRKESDLASRGYS